MDTNTLSTSLKYAKHITKRKFPWFYYLVYLSTSFSNTYFRDLFFLIYGYFRQLDDIVDDPARPQHEKLSLFARHKGLIDGFYQGSIVDTELTQLEVMIRDFTSMDLKLNCLLKPSINQMLYTMEFDLLRTNKPKTRRQLIDYSENMGCSFIRTVNLLLSPSYLCSEDDMKLIARAGCLTYMVRDLDEDLLNGLVNIPAEDLRSFEIDPLQPDCGKVIQWARAQVSELEALYSNSYEAIKRMKSLRLQIAIFLTLKPREVVLRRVKRSNTLKYFKLHAIDKFVLPLELLLGAVSLSINYLLQSLSLKIKGNSGGI